MMADMLSYALEYADNGWYVLPLHHVEDGRCSCGRVCREPGKHPRTRNGLKDATRDPDAIEAWWTAWPNANIGIRTGRISNLWVLDIDAKRSVDMGNGVLVSEGEYTLQNMERQAGEPLPDTLISNTGGGGRHYLFTFPQGDRPFRNRVKVAPSIDVRADDGYIVAPPSVHASGKRYEWDTAGREEPASPPDWLLEVQGRHEGDIFVEQEAVGEGGRNDYLFRYAAKLRGEGRDSEELAQLVMGMNQIACKPPLDRSEVLRIIGNVNQNYQPNPPEPVFVFDETEEKVPELGDGDVVAISFREMMHNPPKPRDVIVGEGLLDKGDGFVLAGVSGVGKSWSALDMGLTIAAGGDWLGRFPTTPSRVLYLDEEAGYTSVHERVDMLRRGAGLTPESDLPFFLSTPKMMKLDDPKGFATVARLIDRYEADVVFFDTMIRFHRGNENSNEEMATFFDRVSTLRNAYGCTFIFIHHIKKPTKDDPGDLADQMRGASDIRGWPDGILMLRRDPNELGMTIVANHAKSRNHKQIDEFLVGVDIDEETHTASLITRGESFSQVTTTGARRDLIKKYLYSMAPQVPYITLPMLAGYVKMAESTVKKHLDAMVANNEVVEFRIPGSGYKNAIAYQLSAGEIMQQKGLIDVTDD